jgi:hypothetical protein
MSGIGARLPQLPKTGQAKVSREKGSFILSAIVRTLNAARVTDSVCPSPQEQTLEETLAMARNCMYKGANG